VRWRVFAEDGLKDGGQDEKSGDADKGDQDGEYEECLQ